MTDLPSSLPSTPSPVVPSVTSGDFQSPFNQVLPPPAVSTTPAAPVEPVTPVTPSVGSYVDSYQPPTSTPSVASMDSNQSVADTSSSPAFGSFTPTPTAPAAVPAPEPTPAPTSTLTPTFSFSPTMTPPAATPEPTLMEDTAAKIPDLAAAPASTFAKPVSAAPINPEPVANFSLPNKPSLAASDTLSLSADDTPSIAATSSIATSSAPTMTPSAVPNSATNNSPAPSSEKSETLEDQNIFHLLGVEDATEDEKEAFLDELQQVIWEDFLENDVDLLLTEEEMVEFKKIMDKPSTDEEAHQSEMVEYLEKLVPDLEKIMLEKALELKEEMMRERMTQLNEQYKELPEKLAKVKQAMQLVEEQKWRAAADMLNAIPA